MFRPAFVAVAATFVISVTACAGGGSAPTGPSPSSAPTPAPGTSPSPGPGQQPPEAFGIASVTLSQADVDSQAQPLVTVSLTAPAPAGGIVVALGTSDAVAARVPATLTIAGGSSSAAFTVTTNTVAVTTSVTISASYGSITRGATLTIRPPVLTAVFTVRSPEKGNDACVLGPTNEVDCTTDGTGSRGFVHQWHWTYWAGDSVLGHTTTSGDTKPRLTTQCAFLEGSRGGDNPDGSKYVQMTIELVVEDRSGTRSSPARRAVKLYPNRLCGFSY